MKFSHSPRLEIVDLGRTDYGKTTEMMLELVDAIAAGEKGDQLILAEFDSVLTVGRGATNEAYEQVGIPIHEITRGGKVTYHGPGQITAYLLLDLRNRKMGVRDLVSGIEASLQRLLARYDIASELRPGAPGVYVGSQKIAQLGLRVSKGCSYHGLSLNVDMDLEPFGRINPCGLLDTTVTHMAAFRTVEIDAVKQQLLVCLASELRLRLAD